MFHNVVALVFMQGINYLIPLLTLPYLTRTLGGYDYGKLSTALTIVQYVVLFIDFGFNLSATKKISENRHDILIVNDVFWSTIFSKAILFGVFLSASLLIIDNVDAYSDLVSTYLYFLPQLIGSVIFPIWLFQGVEKIKVISVVTIVSKLIPLPFLFLFVKTSEDINIAAFILSLPMFLSSIICIVVLYKLGIKFPLDISTKKIWMSIRGSADYFVGGVAISIYTLSTPLILSLVSSYTDVGHFSAADKLRSAVIGIFLILGQAIYPRVSFLICEDMKKYARFVRKLLFSQVIVCFLCAVMFYFWGPKIAVYILGDSFLGVEWLIKLMAPMILFIPASVILSNCIILPHGNTKAYAIIPWITALTHMIYAYILCNAYGAIGGSIALLITEVFSFAALLFYCVKKGYMKRIYCNA